MKATSPDPNEVAGVSPLPPASLELRVVDSADIVARVVTILYRRRCRLRRVDYSVDDHGGGRLIVEYVPPPHHGHRVGAWVNNLVGVLEVRTATP